VQDAVRAHSAVAIGIRDRQGLVNLKLDSAENFDLKPGECLIVISHD
jgi:hypothetical protein